MKLYTLKFYQNLPIGIEEAWNFFSSPFNLSTITPPHMGFQIISELGRNEKMYPGIIICYKISPIKGIKMSWVTEITQVKEHEYFIDEQRFGPYKFWHHQHFFEKTAEGVLMKDVLPYGLPLGPIGRLANRIYVSREIRKIFDFRRKKIEDIFGAKTESVKG